MANQKVMDEFFATLSKTLSDLNILNKPHYIFNSDETGVNMGQRVGKVVVACGAKQAYSEERAPWDHITAHICVSAGGQVLSPFIIFEKNWPSAPYSKHGPDGGVYAISPNGYMDCELYLQWFQTIFLPETSQYRPCVLITDGHESHITLDIIRMAKENGVTILLLPPHTTNILQPLDVGVFGPFKSNASKLIDGAKLLSLAGGYQSINKSNFTAIFKNAFEKTMSLGTIKNAFRKCGIYPFNPDAIDKKRLMPTVESSQAPTNEVPADEQDDQLEVVVNEVSAATPSAVNEVNVTPSAASAATPSDVNVATSVASAATSSAVNVDIIVASVATSSAVNVDITVASAATSSAVNTIVASASTPSAVNVDTIVASASTPSVPSTSDILKYANIPQHLADVFIIPTPNAKTKKTRAVTKSRVITSAQYEQKLQEKKEMEEKKRKEIEERKEIRARNKIRKLEEQKKKGELKKKKILKKNQVVTATKEKNEDAAVETEEVGEFSGRVKKLRKKGGARLAELLKAMKQASSSSDETDESDESSSEEDENNVCGNCRRANPPGEKGKRIDWVWCDTCNTWYHSICEKDDDGDEIDFYGATYACKRCSRD